MAEDGPIRVVGVEEHPVTRVGLGYTMQLAPDLEGVGDVGSGEEALEVCATAQPDVRCVPRLLLIQSRGRLRARDVALRFESSERTVYRNIQTLCEVGVPIVALPGEG